MPALGNVAKQYGLGLGQEVERKARSRAELFMLEDHKASLKSAEMSPARPGYLTHAENLGYGRGYRDAMIEVMSWVTGRDTDEILAEMHDDATTSIVLSNPVPDAPGKPTPWADHVVDHFNPDLGGEA